MMHSQCVRRIAVRAARKGAVCASFLARGFELQRVLVALRALLRAGLAHPAA
jgi:hypothetical protein